MTDLNRRPALEMADLPASPVPELPEGYRVDGNRLLGPSGLIAKRGKSSVKVCRCLLGIMDQAALIIFLQGRGQ